MFNEDNSRVSVAEAMVNMKQMEIKNSIYCLHVWQHCLCTAWMRTKAISLIFFTPTEEGPFHRRENCDNLAVLERVRNQYVLAEQCARKGNQVNMATPYSNQNGSTNLLTWFVRVQLFSVRLYGFLSVYGIAVSLSNNSCNCHCILNFEFFGSWPRSTTWNWLNHRLLSLTSSSDLFFGRFVQKSLIGLQYQGSLIKYLIEAKFTIIIEATHPMRENLKNL